jgi:(2S)-methylsuccinyl-CoA dehydrogenase
MPVAATRPSSAAKIDLLPLAEEAQRSTEALLAEASAAIRPRVAQNGKISASALDREQHAAHGLAWLATYVEIVRQLNAYARQMQGAGRFGDTEYLLTLIGLGETLAQVFGGIPMNQAEFVRLQALGVSDEKIAPSKR